MCNRVSFELSVKDGCRVSTFFLLSLTKVAIEEEPPFELCKRKLVRLTQCGL